MGKKDAQRTKGNTKAASSARSAQFLGENVGFVGFGTSAETAFVPLHSGSKDSSEDVSPDMKVVLRKMHKKDLTTKLKALQEFKELSSEYSDGEVVALLPYWSSVYTKLAMDCDGRVREQSHLCLLTVVTKVGRNLALQLSQLAGVWYLAHFDPHQPAALAASQAWAAAFPPAKQAGAITFCRDHIMALVIENLTLATPHTLSDPNITSPEEMEAKYLRTLSMSMTGLAALMEKAPPSEEQLGSLLKQPKFWKYSRNKDGNVRQGLFEVITQLCSLKPDLANSHGSSLVPAVLTNLQETELGAATAVWTAALQTVSTVREVWDLVSLQKAVLPPLYKLIAAGGAGLAHKTFPSLMPFLSRIPPTVLTEENCRLIRRWLDSFNAAVTSALETNKTLPGGEMNAVVTAYLECIVLILNMQQVDHEEKVNILEEHVLNNLLIRSFSQDKLSDSCLYEVTARFLLSWESKQHMASLNGLLWSSLTHHLTTVIPSQGNFKAPLKLISSFCHQQNRSESVKLVICSVWTVLLEELDHSSNNEPRVLDCLQNMAFILKHFEIGKDEKLRRRLFPDDRTEQHFLDKCVFPLLGRKDLIPAACHLIWSVAALTDTHLAVDILISACKNGDDSCEVIESILETSTSGDGQTRQLWLQHQYVKDLIVRLILEAESSLRSGAETPVVRQMISLVHLVIKSGLILDRAEIGTILQTFLEGLRKKPTQRYLQYVDQFSSLVFDEKDPIWSEGPGCELAFILFTLDNTSSGHSLWLQSGHEELSLKIQNYIKTCLQQNMTFDALKILIRKCLKLQQQSSLERLSNTFPKWEDLPPFSQQYLYEDAVASRSFFLKSPFPDPDVLEEEDVSVVRPNFSLFWSRMILCEYFPSVEVSDSCVTIPDCDRVEMEEGMLMDLGPVIESLCYLTKLMELDSLKEQLTPLKDELEVCVKMIVTRLSRPSYDQIRQRMREMSLREGLLWADGLVWLVRSVYNTSEWSPNLASLMPGEGITWTEAEIITTLKLLRLSSELGLENGAVQQTTEMITATLLSLADSWDQRCDALLWLFSECVGLGCQYEPVGCVLELVLAMTNHRKETLLYDQDISGSDWPEVFRVSSLARFLSVVISSCPSQMSAEAWDLSCCSLVSWCSTIQETAPDLARPSPTTMVSTSVLHLAGTFGLLMSTWNGDSPLPPKLKQEWEEFFSEGVYSVLLPLFVSTAGRSKSKSLRRELSFALLHCPASQVMSTDLPPLHLSEDIDVTAPLPDNITFLYNHLTPLLISPCYFTQLAAAQLLVSVAKNTKEQQEDEEEEMKEVPRRLVGIVRQGDLLLSSLLQEFKTGEVAGSIPPGTVSYTVTLGYLLTWKVILALIQTSGDELRPKYTEYLKSEDFLFSLMRHLFRLLPRNASQNRSLFSATLELSEPTLEKVPELAGSVWISLCRHLPAVARTWWQNLDRTGKETVEKVTATMVTPLLWKEETRAISSAERSDNMSLRVRDSVKEVVATYTIDEGSMELIISLPNNHPLGELSVDTGNRVGVDVGLWRKWMLQLTTFLSYQNGTILEGLNLWKRNVDKRFEGVEECYICFYILHGTNHQLPKLACRTCKKKFHSACLYKWFSTSNNSTCPLCHHSYIVSIAKLCKENGLFTDVTILCDDGKLLAHKIVLAAVSPFLCHVLEVETSNNGQTTIVMPEVRREIVQQLLDFLYTGVMKLSPSATWELQQLVLLLQIDPQNVGVDTINLGHDPHKADRLTSSVCQTLGIKIAHKADISNQNQKVSPKSHSPPTHAKHSPSLIKTSPKPLKPQSLSNGVREKVESPKIAPPAVAPLKIVTPQPLKHSSKKSSLDVKSSKPKSDKPSLNPIKINTNSNSIIRSKPEPSELRLSGGSGGFPTREPSVVATSDNVIKITRKRPLSEAINYSEMDEDPRDLSKRGRGGKSRGKSVGRGGGKGRHQDMDNVVCAICNQFDPVIPGSYNRHGDTTEWIGCDCNRWFHKVCTRLKEVDDSFSCKLVHKTCLPSSSLS